MVVEELEVVLLLLGIFVLVFIIANKRLIDDLPHSSILISAFILFLLSWIFTNLESFFLKDIFNIIEHGVQLIGAVFITAWCWRIFVSEGEDASHSHD